jgi:hypothetical protein
MVLPLFRSLIKNILYNKKRMRARRKEKPCPPLPLG